MKKMQQKNYTQIQLKNNRDTQLKNEEKEMMLRQDLKRQDEKWQQKNYRHSVKVKKRDAKARF